MIDGDQPTLHIRCGSDIRDTLRTAGFGGEFLEYSDPVCEGPVPDTPDLPPIRARYLANGPGRLMGFTEADCLTRLREADRRLAEAHRYDRVVLWFEHDSFDQLVLARVLSQLADGPMPATLELICIDHHPEPVRFNGLGQLSPEALAGLWPQRQTVTPEQIALAREIWHALRQTDPTALQTIAETGTPALPIAAPALRRQLQELPGTTDGLSLTQRIILQTLSEGPNRIGRIFGAMVAGREPLVFMGDIGFLLTMESLADTGVLTIEPGEQPFPRLATLSDTGRRVLNGELDYLSLNPEERWVGNVVCDGQWRWDNATQKPARSQRG